MVVRAILGSGWTQLELRVLVGGQKQWGEGHGFGAPERMSPANFPTRM